MATLYIASTRSTRNPSKILSWIMLDIYRLWYIKNQLYKYELDISAEKIVIRRKNYKAFHKKYKLEYWVIIESSIFWICLKIKISFWSFRPFTSVDITELWFAAIWYIFSPPVRNKILHYFPEIHACYNRRNSARHISRIFARKATIIDFLLFLNQLEVEFRPLRTNERQKCHE